RGFGGGDRDRGADRPPRDREPMSADRGFGGNGDRPERAAERSADRGERAERTERSGRRFSSRD
ncbi:MAG TPA: hypothetical protein VEI97_10075, partial [bacterium]|nr:hypothetical protein [bacterium]